MAREKSRTDEEAQGLDLTTSDGEHLMFVPPGTQVPEQEALILEPDPDVPDPIPGIRHDAQAPRPKRARFPWWFVGSAVLLMLASVVVRNRSGALPAPDESIGVPRGAGWTLEVRDPGGQVVAGAAVRGVRADGSGWEQVADQNGRLRLSYQPAGEIEVMPPAGTRLAGFAFTLVGGGPDELGITLTESESVRVRVLDHLDRPVPGARVSAWTIDHAIGKTGEAVTGADGFAQLECAPAPHLIVENTGRHSLPVGRGGERHDAQGAYTELHVSTDASVLPRTPRELPHELVGRVVPEVPSELWVQDAHTAAWSLVGFTQPDGSFRVEEADVLGLLIRPMLADWLPRILRGPALEAPFLEITARSSEERPISIRPDDQAAGRVWIQLRGPAGHVLDGGFSEAGSLALACPTDGLGRIEALAASDAGLRSGSAFVNLAELPRDLSVALGPAPLQPWTRVQTLTFCDPHALGARAPRTNETVAGPLRSPLVVRGHLRAARAGTPRDLSGVLVQAWSGADFLGWAKSDAWGDYAFEVDRERVGEPIHLGLHTPWFLKLLSRDAGFFAVEPDAEAIDLPALDLRACLYYGGTVAVDDTDQPWSPRMVFVDEGHGLGQHLGPLQLGPEGTWFAKARARSFFQVTMQAEDGSLVDFVVHASFERSSDAVVQHELAIDPVVHRVAVEAAAFPELDSVPAPARTPLSVHGLTTAMGILRASLPIVWRGDGCPQSVLDLLSLARERVHEARGGFARDEHLLLDEAAILVARARSELVTALRDRSLKNRILNLLE